MMISPFVVPLFLINVIPTFAEVPGTNTGNNVPGIPSDFNAYFNGLNQLHNTLFNNKPNIISFTYTTSFGLSSSNAQASLTAASLQQLHQQALAGFAGSIPQQGGGTGAGNSYGYGFGQGAQALGGTFGSTPNGGAISSASIGPNGAHQTAQIYPQNPNNPNVNTRFGSSGGTYSVFTSSQSSSSNINGKPSHFHRATTTVNDNGKVTTYTVQDPPAH